MPPPTAAVASRPRLTVCTMTRNSGDRLEHWFGRVLEFADEVVVLVDASSADDTLEIARRYADSVQVVENPPYLEVCIDHGLRRASGEWILWLDDDEFMSRSFTTRLPELLADPDLTHYLLQVRWAVESDGGYGWLRQFPWHPNVALRLIRNVGSSFHHRGRQHSPIEISGAGRVLHGDDVALFHMDFAWRDRAQREQKVERYRRTPPSCEEYYLYEDYAETLVVEPIQDGELVRDVSSAALAELERRATQRSGAEAATLDPHVATVAEMRAWTARFWDNADVFHAEYVDHSTPTEVLANVPWRTSGRTTGAVRLSYHWVHADYGVVLRQGDRSVLPHQVEAGQTVQVDAALWTPYDPGRWQLQWDLQSEDVAWFSDRGVPPLTVEVEVAAEHRVLSRPRSVATLPAGRPAPTSRPALPSGLRELARRSARLAARRLPTGSGPFAGNVVPIEVVRVLDTRDGTGAPGAVLGPVAADGLVTLQVGGPAVPDYASGVVGNLSVLGGTYNGFVTAFPADGPGRERAFVSAYFADDGRPAVNQLLCSLDRGRLSLHVSANHPGTVHLLLDITGYLTA